MNDLKYPGHMDCPCKDCKDRYMNCHDHCDKYQEWKEWKNKSNEYERANRRKGDRLNRDLSTDRRVIRCYKNRF